MTPVALTADLLRALPLPQPEGGSKDRRGSVLVIAGSVDVAGAAVLTATAALRAGAGRLQVATVKTAALHVAMAVPEAMVIGLAETPDGGIDHRAAEDRLRAMMKKTDAVVLGPGMTEGKATMSLTAALCAEASAAAFVLDAAALCDLRAHADAVRSLEGRSVITPHAGEMAQLLDKSRDEIESDPLGAASEAAGLLNCTVVMKGAQTHVVGPDGRSWLFTGGGVGLAASGSGDVLAGLVGGLLARGAAPIEAALWGVFLHGEAGRVLGQRVGPLGYLMRDLAAEVPGIMHDLQGER